MTHLRNQNSFRCFSISGENQSLEIMRRMFAPNQWICWYMECSLQWMISRNTYYPGWKTGKFCKILYVTKQFLNDFGWLILKFPCLNFICCWDVLQVFSKKFIKKAGFCSLLSNFGRRKTNKFLHNFGCSLINFTSDTQIYNLSRI